MSSNPPYVPAILTAVSVAGGAYCAYKIYQNAIKQKLPENWVEVGKLGKLYAYPIKSCGPIVLKEAECTYMGVKDFWLRDRTLMVVDSKNNFITARVYPDMLLVHPTIKGAILTLAHNDMEPINVNLAEVITNKVHSTATVWGVPVPVYDCGAEVSEWFSKLLAVDGLRLKFYASDKCRKLRDKTNKVVFRFTKDDTGALPDETSFNLINEGSIDDLNTRLTTKVTHCNFRPNFLVEGASAFDEDNWKYIKIGDVIFENIKPCGRCILTTIDPETGIKSGNSEPLETLKGYRLADDPVILKAIGTSPRMGLQISLRSPPGGKIRINDTVYVSYAK